MATKRPKTKQTSNGKALSNASKKTALEYDATKSTGRRRRPSTRIAAEHVILPSDKRKKMLATIQDQVRNISLVPWMIRRHMDYVSKFKFLFQHDAAELSAAVNRLFDWHAQPKNFDIAGRYGREEMFRMFEGEKVGAGDAGMLKLDTEIKLQAIESDLMAYPRIGKWNPLRRAYDPIPEKGELSDVNKDAGVVLDISQAGRIVKFCLCNRGADGNHLSYDHLEPAENMIFDGYWTRFSSQVRGVSPLSTAINSVQDVYEGIDFNLAKAKIHAIFGLAIMRDYAGISDQEEVSGWGGASGITTGTDEQLETATESDDGTKSISASLQEISPNEMMLVDMDTKGKIDTIESKTPSSEFLNFTDVVIRIVLLALDIPFSAFNSRSTSFAGMIADQNLYEISCKWKRDKNLWNRREYSDWLLNIAWESDKYKIRTLAENAGVDLETLQSLIEWVPSGFPWLQKLNEIQGDIKAISAGLDNPIDACKRRGTDFFENIIKIGRAYSFAAEHNVPLMVGESGQQTVDDAAPGDDATDLPEEQNDEDTQNEQ